MQNRNNQLVVYATIAVAFLCAVPLRWFTVTNAFAGTALDIWPGPIAITGINGQIKFFFLTPIWLLLVISTVATAIAAANCAGLTTINQLVPAGMFLLTGAYYIMPFFLTDERVSASVGPVIGVAATAIALVALLSTTARGGTKREPNVA